jgi:hypothetical protein
MTLCSPNFAAFRSGPKAVAMPANRNTHSAVMDIAVA